MVAAYRVVQSGHFTKAIDILQDVLDSGLRRPAAHYFLARSLCVLNRCDRALDHFETARRLRLHPTEPIAESIDDRDPVVFGIPQ